MHGVIVVVSAPELIEAERRAHPRELVQHEEASDAAAACVLVAEAVDEVVGVVLRRGLVVVPYAHCVLVVGSN